MSDRLSFLLFADKFLQYPAEQNKIVCYCIFLNSIVIHFFVQSNAAKESEFFSPAPVVLLLQKVKAIHESNSYSKSQMAISNTTRPCCKKLFFFSKATHIQFQNRHISIYLIHTLRECKSHKRYDRIYLG